ncbi:unnamed protein product [Soboliphyme baturini]|uniref:ARM repeat superfamily protein n=1 Tax=Soboliphyme baturini TaxID=241478 RepID=A0A183J0C8_9BILA|nr:unnamed protein product [Soboliphyme baturini]
MERVDIKFSELASSEDTSKGLDKGQIDLIVNLLIRLSAQVPDQSLIATSGLAAISASNIEILGKRCMYLAKVCLKPDIWGLVAELKVQSWLEKSLLSVVVRCIYNFITKTHAICANADSPEVGRFEDLTILCDAMYRMLNEAFINYEKWVLIHC